MSLNNTNQTKPIKAFCHSLSASWIIRILEGNPDEDNWVQLPRFFLKMLDIEGLNFKFNFDESVSFPDAQRIPLFYRQAFTYYNKALVTDKDLFENTIMNQSLWGNKYVVNITSAIRASAKFCSQILERRRSF